MSKGRKKYILVCILVSLILAYKAPNVKADILPSVPQIVGAATDQKILPAGGYPEITINSKYTGQVEYRIFFYDKISGVLQDVTNGYTQPVDGSKPYTLKSSKPIPKGLYRISVWAKRPDVKGIKQNVNGDYDSSFLLEDVQCTDIPDITNAAINYNGISAGDTPSINVDTRWNGKVQYRIFYYNKVNGNLMDVTGGYTAPVDGNKMYTVTSNKAIPEGLYRISVWVKRAGVTGLKSNSNGDYDDSFLLEDVPSVKTPRITNTTIDTSNLQPDKSSNLTVTSDNSGQVQYRVFVYNKDTSNLEDVTGGYTSAVDGSQPYTVNLKKAYPVGNYRISVWAKQAGRQGIKSNANGDFDNSTTIETYSAPKLSIINNNPVLHESDVQTFTATTGITGQVQYRTFVYNMDTRVLQDVSNGYSSPVDGSTPYTISLNKPLSAGNYRISIWAKRAGMIGSRSNVNGDFDTSYTFEEQSLAISQITNAQVAQQMTPDTNPVININSSGTGQVQYRIFFYNKDTGKLEDVSNGYTAPTNAGTPYTFTANKTFPAGNYRISVWLKRAGQTGYKSNSNGDYDSSTTIETMVQPKLNVQVSKLVMNLGENLSFTASAPGVDKVQYRVFAYDEGLGKLMDLTNGYTAPVDGTKPYTASIPNTFGTGTFRISIWVKRPNTAGLLSNSNGDYDNSFVYEEFCIRNKANESYVNTSYSYTLDDVANKQYSNGGAVYDDAYGNWLSADKSQILRYLNPQNFMYDEYGKYQFLRLNYQDGISAAELDGMLSGKGVLNGKGQQFLDAAKKYNISPIYLVSHSILETGNGRSTLATGVVVNGKTVYNLFGVNAFDRDPIGYGSQYAYDNGWFSVDAAIDGGAQFISSMYINNSYYGQNTLYKMRWNPARPATHQYATDIGWAYKQIYNIKKLLDMCPNAKLQYDIPVYRQ